MKAYSLPPIQRKEKDSKKPNPRPKYTEWPIRTPSNPRGNLRLARGLPAETLDCTPRLRLARGRPSAKRTNGCPLTRPPYGGIKCYQLRRSARVRRRQATTPHSGCDRGPVHQLRSLLSHPRHCDATVGTCDALCERARCCSSRCAANSPSFPRTFPSAEPSNGMGTTLGRGPNLDPIKTPPAGPSERRHVERRGRYPLQEPPRRPPELPGRRRDVRQVRTPPRQPHARRHDLQYPTVYFLQWTFTVCSRFGERRRLLPPSVHVPRPS